MRGVTATPVASDESCPALCRASSSLPLHSLEDVDGRDEPGHDDNQKHSTNSSVRHGYH
jgi:hypothetical protein